MNPAYLLYVGLAVLIALAFPVARHIRGKSQRRQYYLLQSITLLGAVVGAKLSVLFGDSHWPWVPMGDWHAVLWSGRSITGALIFGFLFAEIAKPIMGYKMPPNDRFAMVLPFTIAIGRIGCLTAGCCLGLRCDNWLGMAAQDGVMRYPIPIIEMFFQIAIGLTFMVFVKRGILYGHLFSIYLMAYGIFRFGTEFLRETPRFYGGWSGYQLLSLVMIALGAGFFLKRSLAPPESWDHFRSHATNHPTTLPETTHA